MTGESLFEFKRSPVMRERKVDRSNLCLYSSSLIRASATLNDFPAEQSQTTF
jgi:hypothetical protein